MSYSRTTKILTDKAVLAMLSAAVEKAHEINVPQCIVIVDTSAVDLGTMRMTGAKVLSLHSARAKARTAASTGNPSANIPEAVRPAIAAATGGAVTGLPGGLPIYLDDILVGGIGVGSGTGAQDIVVAEAALGAIGARMSL